VSHHRAFGLPFDIEGIKDEGRVIATPAIDVLFENAGIGFP